MKLWAVEETYSLWKCNLYVVWLGLIVNLTRLWVEFFLYLFFYVWYLPDLDEFAGDQLDKVALKFSLIVSLGTFRFE
jgi:hypothetical protein